MLSSGRLGAPGNAASHDETGIKISDAEMRDVRLEPDAFPQFGNTHTTKRVGLPFFISALALTDQHWVKAPESGSYGPASMVPIKRPLTERHGSHTTTSSTLV